MNIGIVTTWFERGAAIVSRQLMDVLSEEHSIYIYARGEKYARNDPKWNLPNVHWGSQVIWPGSGKIDQNDFENWIVEKSLDLIIFNEQRWWQPIKWANAKGVATAAYIDYYTEAMLPCFDAYDLLICNTERHFGLFKNHRQCHFIPWGTDTTLFSPVDRGPSSSTEVSFFHSAGHDPYRKGTDLVIDAFRQIAGRVPARLIIHCQNESIQFPENIPRLEVIRGTIAAPGLYNCGDVYVYPSRLDGIGLTVCEALSCGLPTITTDCAPMSEFVKDGVNGRLVPVQKTFERSDNYYWPMSEVSINELARVMAEVCEDVNKLNEMKSAARRLAVEERDWNKNSRQLMRIVSDVQRADLTTDLQKTLDRVDRNGLTGKIDFLISTPILNSMISWSYRHYRRLRQPHIYKK